MCEWLCVCVPLPMCVCLCLCVCVCVCKCVCVRARVYVLPKLCFNFTTPLQSCRLHYLHAPIPQDAPALCYVKIKKIITIFAFIVYLSLFNDEFATQTLNVFIVYELSDAWAVSILFFSSLSLFFFFLLQWTGGGFVGSKNAFMVSLLWGQ